MDSKSKLRATSALVFHTVLILLVARFYTVGQHQLVEASIGITGDVMLPCHVEPATDATDELLEWSRQDLNPRFIHVRRDGEDHLVDQNTSYMNRTSVSVDGLKQGNMSLRLSRVRLSDEATYRCFSPRLKTDSRVQLVVGTYTKLHRRFYCQV
uniref:Ig-like domain-containing protein n=1 Tax=Amphiprion percula TaxID=161767 RepID=A0A3P8TG42_AMPPE